MTDSPLTLARDALAAVLQAATGVEVYPEVPDAIDPPCVVLEPAEQYLTAGETFGREYLLTLEAHLLLELASIETANRDLDPLLLRTLEALDAAGWWLAGIGKPGVVTAGDSWAAYGLPLTVQTHLTL